MNWRQPEYAALFIIQKKSSICIHIMNPAQILHWIMYILIQFINSAIYVYSMILQSWAKIDNQNNKVWNEK